MVLKYHERTIGPLLITNGALCFETLSWLLGHFQIKEIEPHFQMTCVSL